MTEKGWKHCSYGETGHPIIDLLDNIKPNPLDEGMISKIARALTINATAAQAAQDRSLQNATDRAHESGIAESRLYADERYEGVVNKEELRLMRESEANEQSVEAGNAPNETQHS